MNHVKETVGDLIHNYSIPILFTGGLALTGSTLFLAGQIKDFKERRNLTEKRARRQKERNEQSNSFSKKFPLTKEAIQIVELPFDELQKKLARRELTARQVLAAFIAKSVVATKEFNCVTEFVPQAWEWAEELDKMGGVKGPLHGVPVCVKENQDVVGMDSTFGLSLLLFKPATQNDPLVQQLMDAGAIPFCKTNIPQTLFSYASSNPIYGTTLNHLNKKLSPGGSSSGAGCLVGAGGAPFATGTDIGGSCRIPAHFSGICTLKPTPGRICGRGASERTSSLAGLASVYGILAPRAKTVAGVYKVLIGDANNLNYDPLVVPITWNDEVYTSTTTLKIGYLTSLPFFPTFGDTPKIVLEAKNALEKLGHVVVPFDLPDNWNIRDVFATLAYADGRWGNYLRMKNDAVADAGEKFFIGKTFSSKVYQALSFLLGSKSTRGFLENPEGQRSQVLWTYLEKQKRIKYEILRNMANLKLDLILMPAFPFPACRVEDAEPLINAVIYTSPWNLCDLPAGVVPFGKESCDKIEEYDDEGDAYLKLAKKGMREAKGMPIGVQIVGKPFNEELVLRVLNELDEFKLREDNYPALG